MSRKVLYFVLLSCSIIIIIASILHTLNPAEIEVKPWYDRTWKTSIANVMIAYFLVGGTLVGSIALMLEAQRAVQIKLLLRRERKRDQENERTIKASEQLALGNYSTAQTILRSVISSEPGNIRAHILLIKSLKEQGHIEEALKATDEARTHCKPNLELLLLSYDVSIAAGNLTSSLDNLSIALAHEPKNSFILRNLVKVTKSMKRLTDAIHYQERLIKTLAGGEAYQIEQDYLAQLELEELLSHSYNLHEKKEKLGELLRRHKNFAPALCALAHCYLPMHLLSQGIAEQEKESEFQAKDLEDGFRLLTQAFRQDPQPKYLEEAALIALKLNQPDKALNIVKTAIAEAEKSKTDTFACEVLAIQLLIALENNSEAEERLVKLEEQLGDSSHLKRERQMLRAILLKHGGDFKQAALQFAVLASESVSLPSLYLARAEFNETGDYVSLHQPDPLGLAKPAPPFFSVP